MEKVETSPTNPELTVWAVQRYQVYVKDGNYYEVDNFKRNYSVKPLDSDGVLKTQVLKLAQKCIMGVVDIGAGITVDRINEGHSDVLHPVRRNGRVIAENTYSFSSDNESSFTINATLVTKNQTDLNVFDATRESSFLFKMENNLPMELKEHSVTIYTDANPRTVTEEVSWRTVHKNL